ncbi:UDP-N-acetylmuramate dehydrogenase [Mesonia sp.]|uniref:UDP-N-acetylmuramate dehydrogenase n=1 Tax=Mesonia sp. TaxID=1960830 RepID=UPI00176AFD06|nr:UDP-N-acetylmuramate dehydrogenase [Mesonia sp.]HIB38452.1 UDP-N-acetylmuramate dehydrogenase [Mesonia sp.]
MKIIENFDLTPCNSYRIKAKCSKAYFPENEKDFQTIFKQKLNKIMIGGGYNIILSKEFYEEEFVVIGETFANIELESDTIISCEAGVNTKTFSEFALNKKLSGAEIFYDIPSSIGGAVVMNAGASGEEIKDILIRVRYLDLDDGKIKEISNKEIGFEYRNSLFQKETNKVVLKAWFDLKSSTAKQIKEKMDAVKDARWAKQPKNYPNAGSVFKRPKGFFVGPMIQELGLKGYTIGDAQISKKHGGFIVNLGNANGGDIIQIIKTVQDKVKERFNVDLEVEQRII